jgi:hypothetical protein
METAGKLPPLALDPQDLIPAPVSFSGSLMSAPPRAHCPHREQAAAHRPRFNPRVTQGTNRLPALSQLRSFSIRWPNSSRSAGGNCLTIA